MLYNAEAWNFVLSIRLRIDFLSYVNPIIANYFENLFRYGNHFGCHLHVTRLVQHLLVA